jgi:glycosyltransferase involved in cell wall biosynthesis
MELIVVDDGSTDSTPLLLSQINDSRLVVHQHTENRGKGAALRSAAALATGRFILPFDADLEYSADDIPKLLVPVLSGKCDVVYGARLFGCNTVYQSYRYALGNRVLTQFANILYDACLNDLHTCLKLIPLAMFENLRLSRTGFGLDTELTAILLRQGVRPFEVPVSYYSRSHAQGKKITWRDALACLLILVRVRLVRNSRLTHAAVRAPEREHTQVINGEQTVRDLATVTTLTIGTDQDDYALSQPTELV